MELELKKGTFRCFAPVFSKCLTAEESSDAVVPDSKPDILRIIDSSGWAEITGKELRGGKIYLSGAVRCFVIYASEGDGGPESVPVTLKFSVCADVGGDIPKGAFVKSCIENVTVLAREQNPRRISVRATVRMEVSLWTGEDRWWCEDIESAAEHGVELLCEDLRTMTVSGIGEKLLNISESAELGEIKVSGAELLKWELRPRVSEAKLIPGKIVFKGEIALCALIKTPEDPVQTAHVTLSVPFSGVTDCVGADTDADGNLNAECFDSELSVSEEPGTGRGILNLKTNLGVWAEARRVIPINAVTDAYSVSENLKAQFSPFALCPEFSKYSVRADLREGIPAGIGVKKVFCADGHIEEISVCDGELCAVVGARVIFEGADGSVYSAVKNLRAAAAVPGVSEGVAVDYRVTGEGYRISAEDEIEFTAAVEAAVEVRREEVKNLLSGASVIPVERNGRRPSLTLCGMLDGESWWDLGKRMRARVEDILSANGISETDPPGDRMLLIPQTTLSRSGKIKDGGEF
ncbi:MAG: DUF3794 domain-containing protein [Clostridia bacterium]|nr:DUF3794 domain-containing protein [Clostridia bacterium]